MVKILCVADVPGWAVDNMTAIMIDQMPQYKWTKIYWVGTTHEEMARQVEAHDIVYLANHDYGPRFLGVFEEAKHPRVIITFRSWRYDSEAVPFAQEFAKEVTAPSYKLCIHLADYLKNVTWICDPLGEQFVPSRKVRVGFVGQTDNYKGYPLVVEACKEFGAELVVAPRGNDQIAYSDMPKWYESVDVVVVASEKEGFGTIAVEAMAMNTPVITTDVGTAENLDCIKVCRNVGSIVGGLNKLFGRNQILRVVDNQDIMRKFSHLFDSLSGNKDTEWFFRDGNRRRADR